MTSKLQVVKLEFLKDLGDEELIQSLLVLYLEQMDQTKADLRSLYLAKSWFPFGKLCHKVKGSVVIFGMNMLANKLKVIQLVTEQYAKADLEAKQKAANLNELELKMLKELNEIDLNALEMRYPDEWPRMAESIEKYKQSGDFSYVTTLFEYSLNQLDLSVIDVQELLKQDSGYLQ